MLRFVASAVLIVAVSAYGRGGAGAGAAGGYGGGARGGASAGVALNGGFVAGGAGGYNGQVVNAAIQTNHRVEFRDVPSTGSVNPTLVEVGANSLPVTILFRSASSNLNVQQAHDGAQGSTQESQSEDEAHILKHSVTKPIIQEVREVITPFRKITQEIQPVQEEINTIVSRNSGNAGYAGNGGAAFAGNNGAAAGFGGAVSSGRASGAGYGASGSSKSSSGRSSSKGGY